MTCISKLGVVSHSLTVDKKVNILTKRKILSCKTIIVKVIYAKLILFNKTV